MARNRYDWTRVTDPDGGRHWIREKSPSGAQKTGKAMHSFKSVGLSLPSIFLLFCLLRFVLYQEFGFEDTYFVKYPNAADLWGNEITLYYVDVFQWVKDVLISIGNFKTPFVEMMNCFTGVLGQNVADNVFNMFVLFLNIWLSIWKVLLNLPITVIGLIVGGPFSSWIAEGGWVYETMRWNIPYAEDVVNNIVGFFDWLGGVVSNWGGIY